MLRDTVVPALATVALIVAATAPGCSSRGQVSEQSTKAVKGLVNTQDQLKELDASVERAATALGQLRGAGDVKSAFSSFGKAVESVESDYASTKATFEGLQKRATAYTDQWQQEVAKLESETLRAAASERQALVKERFNEIVTAAREANQAFQPLLKTLQEVEQVLKLDPTPAAVKSIDPTLGEAIKEAEAVRTELGELQAELGKLTAGLRPEG